MPHAQLNYILSLQWLAGPTEKKKKKSVPGNILEMLATLKMEKLSWEIIRR